MALMSENSMHLGLAAALSSLACRARRAPELPDVDDERESVSDSLDDDEESKIMFFF